tara:strand:+ start:6457 stop:8334 length:1878 start_codon:yes stop_codon:yes gene_type:complete
MRLITVIGARPQFVKAAVVSKEIIKRNGEIEELVIHTGQHFDINMSDIFFKELNIPSPVKNLAISSNKNNEQLALMVKELTCSLEELKADMVLVYGDTNSTLASAIASTQLNLPLIHVEGGERIYRRMNVPEETNRIITDHVSSTILTSTNRALQYLDYEGLSPRSKFVGDPMYDLFLWALDYSKNKCNIFYDSLDIKQDNYNLATLHRRENTAQPEILIDLLNTLDSSEFKVVLPIHPRVKKIVDSNNYSPRNNLKIINPLGYFDFQKLLLGAKTIFTDSGGVTREAYFAKKPCIIPMENSWWAEVVESGWAKEVGRDKDLILKHLDNFKPQNNLPQNIFGNGRSAIKIVDEIQKIASIEFKNLDNFTWHNKLDFKSLPKNQESTFSYENYIKISKNLLNKGYKFSFFDEFGSQPNNEKNIVLMRHDIDMSLESALQLAKIENAIGVKSTYFFMISNNFYNVLSRESKIIISEILSLGHAAGLHFDIKAYSDFDDAGSICSSCHKEAEILSNWFETPIKVISFHRPNKFILEGSSQVSAPLLHTYMPRFTKKIKYFSDSSGSWRFGHPLDSKEFFQSKSLHILTHPIWWKEKPKDPYQNLSEFILNRKSFLELELSKNCKTFRV